MAGGLAQIERRVGTSGSTSPVRAGLPPEVSAGQKRNEVVAAPGNPGIADLAACEPLPTGVTDPAGVVELAGGHRRP